MSYFEYVVVIEELEATFCVHVCICICIYTYVHTCMRTAVKERGSSFAGLLAEHGERRRADPAKSSYKFRHLCLLWQLLSRVAVQELKLTYHNPEHPDTMLFTMYPCHGNLIEVPQQQPNAYSIPTPNQPKIPR